MKKPDTQKKAGGKNIKEPEPEIVETGPHIFEVLKEKIKNNIIDENKREKSFLIDYSICIIKPLACSVAKTCRAIVTTLEKENFDIFDIKLKTLTEEEIGNIYFKHTNKDYYDNIVSYMTCGPVAILVVVNKEDSYIDSNGIKTIYKSPVIRLKEIVGNKDPTVAKTTNPNSLRAIYGIDIIKNELWSSDSASDAYRELSVFKMSLPAKPPIFKYEVNKLTIRTIMKFLFPEKPNHPDVSGRLDIFAKFGPVLDYHMLDLCFCRDCKLPLREGLTSLGISLKVEKDKALSDEFLSKHKHKLCSRCISHIDNWSHLYTGKEQTHIMTNEEINFLIYETNKEDLFQILKAEKGSSAKTIIEKYDIKKYPKELEYSAKHIEKLLSNAFTDFYDRYEFNDLQKLILEDRRIRLNFWVSKLIGKPSTSFKNPNLINNIPEKEKKNLKGKHFTLSRTDPIKVRNEEEERLKGLIIKHPIFIKEKLTDTEINNKINKLLSYNFYKVSNIGDKDTTDMVSNMILLRDHELEDLKVKEKEYMSNEENNVD